MVPACVVSKIREIYPSSDGTYTGYKEDVEIPEMALTWEGD